jgi:hypothetical protein
MTSRATASWMLGLIVLTLAEGCARRHSSTDCGDKLDLRFVSNNAVAAIVAHPRRILTSSGAEWLPNEMFTASGVKEFGFDPLSVEQLVMLVEPPSRLSSVDAPPITVIVRFSRTVDQELVSSRIVSEGQDRDWRGHIIRTAIRSSDMSCSFIDNRTLLVAPIERLLTMLSVNVVDSPLRRQLAAADDAPDIAFYLAMVDVRAMLSSQMELATADLPPQLENDGDNARVELFLTSHNEKEAAELNGLCAKMLESAKDLLVQQFLSSSTETDRQTADAMSRYAHRVGDKFAASLRPTKEGVRVAIRLNCRTGIPETGLVVAILLPAVQAAREAARLAETRANSDRADRRSDSRQPPRGSDTRFESKREPVDSPSQPVYRDALWPNPLK